MTDRYRIMHCPYCSPESPHWLVYDSHTDLAVRYRKAICAFKTSADAQREADRLNKKEKK